MSSREMPLDLASLDSLLYDAINEGHIKLIENIFQQGYDPYQQGKDNFYYAVRYGELAVVKLFVEHGFPIKDQNYLPVRNAYSNRKENVFFYLLDQVPAEYQHTAGEHYLYQSCLMGRLPFIKGLVDRGFDINKTNCLADAIRNDYQDVLVYLKTLYNLDVEQQLAKAIQSGYPPDVIEKITAWYSPQQYKQLLEKKLKTHEGLPDIQYEAMQDVGNKTNTDLELLKRLKGYLNGG